MCLCMDVLTTVYLLCICSFKSIVGLNWDIQPFVLSSSVLKKTLVTNVGCQLDFIWDQLKLKQLGTREVSYVWATPSDGSSHKITWSKGTFSC